MERKKARLSLFADDVILYIDNPKVCTKKLLELISEFSKIVGYKNLLYFYTLAIRDPKVKLRKQLHL